VQYIYTKQQVADSLSKPLSGPEMIKARQLLGLVPTSKILESEAFHSRGGVEDSECQAVEYKQTVHAASSVVD
jgi:hypothetical protein